MGNRLYVGNLSFQTSSETIREAFARFGEVTDALVVTDRMTGRPRGFTFVTMGTDAEAQRAMQGMNGAPLDGRSLRVNEAEARAQRSGGFSGGGAGPPRDGGGRDRRKRW
jgi:RNA recognition motif-containing protein